MSDLPLLFVYGAARTDPLLAGRPRRGATVAGELWSLPGRAPVLVPGPGARVEGELVEGVDARLLDLLDHLAGVRDGAVARAWVDARVGLRTARACTWVADPSRARVGRRVLGGRRVR